MARQLWLLRHGEAEPHGTRPDPERRLTDRGLAQARAAGLAMARLGVELDAVLYSPKARARDTARAAAEAWPRGEQLELAEHPPLASGFDGSQALEAMASAGGRERLLLVGHEPDLSTVVAQLAGARIDLKKGGLVALRLGDGGCELVLLLRPRELASIAARPDGGD